MSINDEWHDATQLSPPIEDRFVRASVTVDIRLKDGTEATGFLTVDDDTWFMFMKNGHPEALEHGMVSEWRFKE